MRTFSIDPRAPELGGGFNLSLFENGEPSGGGVFPLSAYADEAQSFANEGDTRDIGEIASDLAYEDAYNEGTSYSED